jgi:hypothetical protein
MRDLSVGEIEEFQDQGLIILRNVLVPELMMGLSETIRSAYDFIDGLVSDERSRTQTEALGIRVKECHDFGWITFDDLAKCMKARGGDYSGVIRVVENLAPAASQLAGASLRPSKLQTFIQRRRGYRRDTPVMHLSDCSVTRRQSSKAASAKVQWHRDYRAAFTQQGRIGLNFWVPLQHVGDELPSLELLPASGKVLLEQAIPDLSFAEEAIQRYFPGQIPIAPELDPGDVIVFHYHTVHRTQPYASLPEDRLSAEFRFIAS